MSKITITKEEVQRLESERFRYSAIRVSIEGSYGEMLTAEEKVEDVMQKGANACDAVM